MKDAVKMIAIHLLALASGTAIFIGLFHTPLLGGVKILFYRGLGLLSISGIILGGVELSVLKLSRIKWVDTKDVVVSVVLLLCLNLTFFTLVPVTIERSISVWMLTFLNEEQQELTGDEITDEFIGQYVIRQEAMKKRFEEQTASGTVSSQGGKYTITSRGRNLVKLYDAMAKVFAISQ